jgi:repressor LexA
MQDEALTPRRRQILKFIRKATAKKGYPPTVREIGKAVGLSSSSSVQFHLRALAEAGRLHRDGSLTRALRMQDTEAPPQAAPLGPSEIREATPQIRWLPVLGEVAAGQPIFADEQLEDLMPLPSRLAPNGEAFMLRVEGDSMIDAGIRDGDYVIVSRTNTADEGDIVVALLDDEATVKSFHRYGDGFELRPANPSMTPIYADEVRILGRVKGILRTWG